MHHAWDVSAINLRRNIKTFYLHTKTSSLPNCSLTLDAAAQGKLASDLCNEIFFLQCFSLEDEVSKTQKCCLETNCIKTFSLPFLPFLPPT